MGLILSVGKPQKTQKMHTKIQWNLLKKGVFCQALISTGGFVDRIVGIAFFIARIFVCHCVHPLGVDH